MGHVLDLQNLQDKYSLEMILPQTGENRHSGDISEMSALFLETSFL